MERDDELLEEEESPREGVLKSIVSSILLRHRKKSQRVEPMESDLHSAEEE